MIVHLITNKNAGNSGYSKGKPFQSPGDTGNVPNKQKNGVAMCFDSAPDLGIIEVTTKVMPGLDIEQGYVTGMQVSVLRDTGSIAVFVRSKFVKHRDKTGGMRIITADGSKKQCSEVTLNVDTKYVTDKIIALVLDNTFADIIIGNRVQTVIPNVTETESKEICQAVETRSQRKREAEVQSRDEMTVS